MKTNYLRQQMERPKYKKNNSTKHVGIKNGNECQQRLRQHDRDHPPKTRHDTESFRRARYTFIPLNL